MDDSLRLIFKKFLSEHLLANLSPDIASVRRKNRFYFFMCSKKYALNLMQELFNRAYKARVLTNQRVCLHFLSKPIMMQFE